MSSYLRAIDNDEKNLGTGKTKKRGTGRVADPDVFLSVQHPSCGFYKGDVKSKHFPDRACERSYWTSSPGVGRLSGPSFPIPFRFFASDFHDLSVPFSRAVCARVG